MIAADHRLILQRRLHAAVQRIGDATLIARARRLLTSGNAADVFELLADVDPRVATAAHECALLRFGYIAAIVAQAFDFDVYERDDLVQRTFLDLPGAVSRVRAHGIPIMNPEGWLRRRAFLMARQMIRQERGVIVRDSETGAPALGPDGRALRTHGTRVSVEGLEERQMREEGAEETIIDRLDWSRTTADIGSAIRRLEAERPLWAEVIRLHYFDGYRMDQIAFLLGRTHGTVRNDAQHARTRLLAIIHEHYPTLEPDGTRRSRAGAAGG